MPPTTLSTIAVLLLEQGREGLARNLAQNQLPNLGQLEARDLLARLARFPRVARFLLLAAQEAESADRHREAKMDRSTCSLRLKRARAWLRAVRNGEWRAPTMPVSSKPLTRKRKR